MSVAKEIPRVYVGMSGGVDSSVSAALLLEKGYDVTGVYMKNWTQDLPGMICPWADDLADAKRVAVRLGIDFKVFDFEADYKHKVVDYMIREYRLGRTPNPDIMCNQEIKFKLFLETALEEGADLIATGHYARVKHVSAGISSKTGAAANVNSLAALSRKGSALSETPTEAAKLFMAADTLKDQTYFLYRVTEQALQKTLFPIGDITTKAEVRTLAKKFGLPTAEKKDSQGICFVGKVGIRDFLSEYVKTEPGEVIDQATGKVRGRHDGAIFYTIGQRHGLDIGGGLPFYVTGKDMAKNEVYVTTDLNHKDLWRDRLTLHDIHWITPFSDNAVKDFSEERPLSILEAAKKTGFTPEKSRLRGTSSESNESSEGGVGNMGKLENLHVRLRHRAPLVDCTLEGTTLTLAQPQRAIAPGQSAVLYSGEQCLGGGIIF